MSLRATFILVVLLIGVGLAWYLMRDSTPGAAPSEADNDEVKLLLADEAISIHRLTQIEITRPSQTTIVLKQNRGRWQMTQPAVFAVDASKIANLLAIIEALVVLPSDDPVATLPALMARVSLSDGENNLSLSFGNRMGRGVGPVAIGGNQQYVLTDDLAHEILERLEPTDLFSPSLQTPSAFESQAVTIASELGEVNLHQEDGRWYIGEGTAQRALSVPIPGYIDIPALLNIPRHSGAKVAFSTPFPPAPLAAYGLDQPRLTITYTHTADGHGQAPVVSVLTIGGPDIGRQQSWFGTYGPLGDTTPVVFSIPAEFSITMARSADAFRDPRIVETLALDVESVDLDFGTHRCEIDAANFTVSPEVELNTPPLPPADRLRQFAGILSAATAVGYDDKSAIAGQTPLVTIVVQPRYGVAAERLAIYPLDIDSLLGGIGTSVRNAAHWAGVRFSGDLSGSPREKRYHFTPTLLVSREGEAAVIRVPRDRLAPLLALGDTAAQNAQRDE